MYLFNEVIYVESVHIHKFLVMHLKLILKKTAYPCPIMINIGPGMLQLKPSQAQK